MAKNKPYVPTEKEQKVAVHFLEQLIILNWDGAKRSSESFTEELSKLIDEMIEIYKIESDPFTSFPCTTKEYLKNNAEYQAQLFEEKWGYRE